MEALRADDRATAMEDLPDSQAQIPLRLRGRGGSGRLRGQGRTRPLRGVQVPLRAAQEADLHRAD